MPLAWMSEHARNQWVQSRPDAERCRLSVQATAGDPGTDVPENRPDGASGLPVGPGAGMLGRMDDVIESALDTAFGDDLENARGFLAARRPSRAHARSETSTPARPPVNANENDSQLADSYPSALADPILERLAHDFAGVDDAKAAWPALLSRLKALLPSSEAVQARVRVWDRRRDLMAQRKKAAKLAARQKAMGGK